MNLCHKLSFFAAGVLGAGSCFGGFAGLVSDPTSINVDWSLQTSGIKVTYPTVLDHGGQVDRPVSTVAFQLDVDKTGSVFSDWVFFCFEIPETLGKGDSEGWTYREEAGLLLPDSPISAAALPFIKELFQKSYLGRSVAAWTAPKVAAFQLALWELVYESDLGSLDIGSGVFNASAGGTVVADANNLLAGLTGTPEDKGTLFGFTHPTFQNQISYVPEPSVLGLQALFLIGLLLRRKRS
jgi:hypothetical protein